MYSWFSKPYLAQSGAPCKKFAQSWFRLWSILFFHLSNLTVMELMRSGRKFILNSNLYLPISTEMPQINNSFIGKKVYFLKIPFNPGPELQPYMLFHALSAMPDSAHELCWDLILNYSLLNQVCWSWKSVVHAGPWVLRTRIEKHWFTRRN